MKRVRERLELRLVVMALAITTFFVQCQRPEFTEEPTGIDEWYSGGQQTVFDRGASAFSNGFPMMSQRDHEIHEVGDLAFEATFVSGGALHPGLGPVYNSVSCVSCHISDGRGTPVGPGTDIVSLLIRLSIPGEDAHGGPLAAPGFGGQLQQKSIFGSQPEAAIFLSYQEQQGTYTDGTSYSLRVPSYAFPNSYMAMPADVMYSPRIAPPVFGLGLLEAVAESTILEYEDANDANGDGISGRANYTWDVVKKKRVLGRFGWKAAAPTVLQQTAGAYNEDMGITSYVFPFESSFGQSQNNDNVPEPELSDSLLEAATHYVRTLAVPGRRNLNEPDVVAGKKIFNQIQCAACHRPMMETAVNVAFPPVSNQRIFPYSDMLVHDMGPALADNRPDFGANGNEWRTPPLWGIGLTPVVNGHDNYLHDGRARSLEEAILWHGGEAEQSKEAFRQLSLSQRMELLAFLKSL